MYEFKSSFWERLQTLGLGQSAQNITMLLKRTMIVYTVYMIVQLFVVLTWNNGGSIPNVGR